MINLSTVSSMRPRWNKLNDHETRETSRRCNQRAGAWNLMIREKKHFPRTLLRHISGSLSLHTSTEYLQNRYRGFSYGRRDVLNPIRPTDRLPTRRGRGDAARIKFLWMKCLHRTPLHRCGPVANGSAH